MNNIIIGSIVLCKLMISEPQNTMSTVESSSTGSQSRGATGNQILDQFNVVEKKVIEKKTKEIEKDGDHVAIVGEVEEIRSVTKYSKNPETGKYKKTQYNMLVVKSEKIDRLFIEPSACGLAEELMESDKKKEVTETVIPEKKEVINKPKASKSKLPKTRPGEYIVVPADTVLGDEYEVITDEKLEKKILEAIQKNDKKQVAEETIKIKEVEQKTEENLLDSQAQTFTKTVEAPVKEEIVEKEIVKEEPKAAVPPEDVEMFDFFAKEPKKETPKIVKEEVKKIEKKPEPKKEKKMESLKVKDEISSEEKSVLSEALDIAF
jgi:hypothetical protein